MIELIQHSIDESSLLGYFNKMNDISLDFDTEIIKKDLARLEEMEKAPKNKYDAKNLKELIKYLNKLLKMTVHEDEFELAWDIKNGLPVSYPLPLINEKAYGICTANYINVDAEEQIVEINLYDLADLIAYSFMSRDLDETHESIEELLKDCGITGLEDANILLNHFRELGDNPYELSKSLKIGSTPYYSVETKEIFDYFHSKKFRTDKYREVVDYSCRYASTAIMSSIVENSSRLGLDAKPIMIGATGITFITNAKDEIDIKNKLIDSISIRVFGRRFKIEAGISIF